jgi:hypothetical protein
VFLLKRLQKSGRGVILAAMTDQIHNEALPAESDTEIARLIWQMAGIGVALLAAAAGLLWYHFGPVIFFDTLATLQSCF